MPKPAVRRNTNAPHDCAPASSDQTISFDFRDYQVGTKMAQAGDIQTECLNILAEGCVRVKVQCSLGESTLHMFRPGDMLKLSAIENLAQPDAGTPSQIRTVIVADRTVKILRLEQGEMEKVFRSESKLTCKLIQDTMKRWHEALLRMSAQCQQIKNYIYG
jgi:hypothetical protein